VKAASIAAIASGSVTGFFVCSCGATGPNAGLEAHLAGHGVERDTYAAAVARRLVRETDEFARETEDGDEAGPDSGER
jgi:hypothetical protein